MVKLNFVTNYLTSLMSDGNIRPLKEGEMTPTDFNFKSGTGTSGEISYKGIDYAYAVLPSGKLKVMTSVQAGDNWSETIYKGSL